MGKRAETKVLAGAERVGASRVRAPDRQRSRTQARDLLEAADDPRRHAGGGRGGGLRAHLGPHRARPHRRLPAGLLRQLRRQGRVLPAGLRRRRGAGRSAGRSRRRPARRPGQGQLRAGLGALLDFLDAEPDIGRGPDRRGPRRRAARRWPSAAAAMQRVNRLPRPRPRRAGESEAPPAIAPRGSRRRHPRGRSTRASPPAADEGFRQLLPEFMYFAVMPYFGAEARRAPRCRRRTPSRRSSYRRSSVRRRRCRG